MALAALAMGSAALAQARPLQNFFVELVSSGGEALAAGAPAPGVAKTE
jgi:hypothetical protein